MFGNATFRDDPFQLNLFDFSSLIQTVWLVSMLTALPAVVQIVVGCQAV
jgi:hypothetical protein